MIPGGNQRFLVFFNLYFGLVEITLRLGRSELQRSQHRKCTLFIHNTNMCTHVLLARQVMYMYTTQKQP